MKKLSLQDVDILLEKNKKFNTPFFIKRVNPLDVNVYNVVKVDERGNVWWVCKDFLEITESSIKAVMAGVNICCISNESEFNSQFRSTQRAQREKILNSKEIKGNVCIAGMELDVDYHLSDAVKVDYDSKPEPGEIEIDAVYLSSDTDIKEFLHDQGLTPVIENQIAEQL